MGGLFGGGSSAPSTSTVDNRLSAMQIQTSNYGKALQIVYGTTRVSPNLIYYTDFRAIAHTTVTSSGGGGGGGGGGKGGGGGGGGGSSSNTTFTYQAALLMALGEGQMNNIGSIWRSKDKFVLQPSYITNDSVITGYTDVVTGYDDWGNPAQWDSQPNYGIVQTYHPAVPALDQLGMALATGSISQSPQPYLSSNHPGESLGYSGIAYVFGWSVDLQASAAMYNYSFEAYGKFQYGGGIIDANPKDVIYDILTNAQYGCNFKATDFGSLTDFSNYCIASGIFISPAYDVQKSGADTVTELAIITNSAPVYSDGVLRLVPYQDSVISGNGVTYTPNIVPVYDLNDDDFIIKSAGDDPIKISRKTSADAFNQVQVEFMNRANDYNIDIATAKDQASIETSGFKPQSVTQIHAICDPVVAQKVANNMLQRVLYIRNTYEFTLGWKYGRLEPMDIVTLSDDILGFHRVPVRITIVQEDEEGNLSITAEECNFGTASSSLYPHQINQGFAHNYNALPGNVSAPSFFEPPIDLTSSGLEVWAALSGTNDLWGGCSIWVSLDGNTYKKQGQIFGGARYGTLTASLNSSNSLSVSLSGTGGQLLSGSALEAAALQTLCMVTDGVNTEYLSYQTATLISANTYTLTGLVRGAYSSHILNKPLGTKFVRVDSAIGKSGALDFSLIGKKVYFKFTSFNHYLGGEQSLADVNEYPYQITGEMVKLSPDNVADFSINEAESRFTLTWSKVANIDLAGYHIRWINGDSRDWGLATPIHEGILVSSPYISATRPAGYGTLMIKAVDKLGNESITPAAIVINLGDALVANVVQTVNLIDAGLLSSISNGSLISSNVVANEIGSTWNPNANSNMWHLSSIDMWRPQTFSEMVYEVTFQVPPMVAGSQLTLPSAITGNNWNVEYRKLGPNPIWSSDGQSMWSSSANLFWNIPNYLPWPGAVIASIDQYQIRISMGFGGTQGVISSLIASFDVADIAETLSAVSVSITGTRLPISKSYFNIKVVNVSLLAGSSSAFIARVIDKSSTLGPLVQCYDIANNPIAGTIDAIVQGY